MAALNEPCLHERFMDIGYARACLKKSFPQFVCPPFKHALKWQNTEKK